MTTRKTRALATLVAAGALLAASTGISTAKPASISLVSYERHINPWVKQQSPGSHQTDVPQTDPSTWVRNPTPCAWDADDRWTWTVNGFLNIAQSDAYLDARASSVKDECVVSDNWYPTHLFAIWVEAPSPSLVVSITAGAETVVAVPVRSGKDWVYKACRLAPLSYPQAEIPGSTSEDGTRTGVGVQFSIRYEIRNPTGSRVRSIGGVMVLDLSRTTNQAIYCP